MLSHTQIKASNTAALRFVLQQALMLDASIFVALLVSFMLLNSPKVVSASSGKHPKNLCLLSVLACGVSKI